MVAMLRADRDTTGAIGTSSVALATNLHRTPFGNHLKGNKHICWYKFAIKKSPDELHTLVGDPELMGEYEDVSDTGIICNDLSTKTLFLLYFGFLMADNFIMKKLCKIVHCNVCEKL